MTTNKRLSRFQNDKLLSATVSGALVNLSLQSNGILRTNIKSTSPTEALFSIPVQISRLSNDKVAEMYDTTFSEFVDQPITSQPLPNVESESLNAQLTEIITNSDSLDDANSLIDSQQSTIIQLRILLGQGTTASDFSTAFPYLPNS